MNKKFFNLSVFLSVALMVGPSHLQEFPESYPQKTLTLKQTTDDQTDEIIPDVDSTLIPSLVGGCGVNWNENLEATDFPDVRAMEGHRIKKKIIAFIATQRPEKSVLSYDLKPTMKSLL